jgi:hypothetical protein
MASGRGLKKQLERSGPFSDSDHRVNFHVSHQTACMQVFGSFKIGSRIVKNKHFPSSYYLLT